MEVVGLGVLPVRFGLLTLVGSLDTPSVLLSKRWAASVKGKAVQKEGHGYWLMWSFVDEILDIFVD